MRRIKWSDDLAAVAQRHADQCTFAHDKFKQRCGLFKHNSRNLGPVFHPCRYIFFRRLPDWPKVGQNLWFGSSSKKGHPKKITAPIKKAVDMW